MKAPYVLPPHCTLLHRAAFWPKRVSDYRARRMKKIFEEIDAAPIEQIRNYCRPIWVSNAKRAQDNAQREARALVEKVSYQFRPWAQHAVDGIINKLRWTPEQAWEPPIEWGLLALIVPKTGSALYGTDTLSRMAMSLIGYLFDKEEAHAAILRIDKKLSGTFAAPRSNSTP